MDTTTSAAKVTELLGLYEQLSVIRRKGPAAPIGHVVPLGEASVVRRGRDVTMVALASTVDKVADAARRLAVF